MAISQDVADRIARRFRDGKQIWETMESVTSRSQLTSSEIDYLFEWYGETLHSIDWSCEVSTTRFEASGWEKWLDSEDSSEEKLICHHMAGVSFDSLISREAIALCLYASRVVFFNCFLFSSGIALEKYAGSVSGISGLTERISSLADKWKLRSSTTDSCANDLGFLWSENISDADKEDAMKFLYQVTLSPLSRVTRIITREMDRYGVGDLNAETRRAKWSDAVCAFLQEYDSVFFDSADTEFLYDEFTEWHFRTAELHIVLGNYERATEMLGIAIEKLDGINDTIMVPKWATGQPIVYERLDPIMKYLREISALRSLVKYSGQESYVKDFERKMTQIQMEVQRRGLHYEEFASEHGLLSSPFDRQLNDIMRLVQQKRYSEAKETFKQLDPERCRSRATLRRFLEFLNFHLQNTGSTWESFCTMLDLFLDVSEELGDRQLTANFLQQYGIRIGCHSLGKLPKQDRWRPQVYGIGIDNSFDSAQEASSLKLWLKEELNLQFPSPAPECVQEVISCLRDACSRDEHKRPLPEMLKACRLLKRSIDIYSDLLHNWTPQGSSNEVQWLQLLESREFVQRTLQSYLLVMQAFCTNCELDVYNDAIMTKYQTHSIKVDPTAPESIASEALLFAIGISALVWVERGRTRSLLNQLGPWYSTINDCNGNLASLKAELIKFDNDEKAALNSILYSCRLTWASSGLDSLFVEYVSLGDNMYVAFLIEVGKEEKYSLSWREVPVRGYAKGVEQLVEEFYETVALQRKSNDEAVVAKLQSLLETLYDVLVGPFWEDYLFTDRDPSAPLIFVPDKTLYRVPFALLRDRKTKKYLFELHTISIAPSLRALQYCALRLGDLEKCPLKPEGCILAVGNPAYADVTRRLPGTGEELANLRASFPGRVKTLENAEATSAKFLELVEEASVSEDGHVFGFIHLGVHGHWSQTESQIKTGSLEFAPPVGDGNQQPSSIGQSHTNSVQESDAETMSGDHDSGRHRGKSAFGEVGVITRAAAGRCHSSSAGSTMLSSDDVIRSGFQWRTPLVVLSACNSSRGQGYYDGEVNLPRALMIAGVPAAVVSQWAISDGASPAFIKALYSSLLTGQCVASALQSAMLHIYESDPACHRIFEWGSFVVWGFPSVRLPLELRSDFAKAHIFDCWKVNALLASHAHNTVCALEKKAIYDTISAMERLLRNPWDSLLISQMEELYTVVLLEDIKAVERSLEAKDRLEELLAFRVHVMYAQAMKGSPQVALDCIDKVIEALQRTWKLPYDGPALQGYRQERAVIWRLMGEYEKALTEFDALLAFGEDYECLTQASYLKDLMNDKSGALEYARRARKLERPQLDSRTLMTLGVRALPYDYRRWLVSVDKGTVPWTVECSMTF